MKQYALKPWKNPPESPVEDATKADTNSTKPARKPQKPYKEPKDKLSLIRALSKEHPIVSLRIGTLSCNVRTALNAQATATVVEAAGSAEAVGAAEEEAMADEVIKCIRGAVQDANRAKRRCQGILGMYSTSRG